jgi:hypothetical protein
MTTWAVGGAGPPLRAVVAVPAGVAGAEAAVALPAPIALRCGCSPTEIATFQNTQHCATVCLGHLVDSSLLAPTEPVLSQPDVCAMCNLVLAQ